MIKQCKSNTQQYMSNKMQDFSRTALYDLWCLEKDI